VLRATRHHASNLARFATIYKLGMLALKYYGPTPGKEGQFIPRARLPTMLVLRVNMLMQSAIGPYDSFFAGLVGGYFVFGGRSRRTGKISSVNQQIVIYIFARVALALARLLVKPGTGFSLVSAEPLRSKINYYAWPAFASLSWAMVMLLFKHHPEELQSSLRGSMTYIYKDCNDFSDLRTLVWHNK
jgi:peroxisomal membrane protein 4